MLKRHLLQQLKMRDLAGLDQLDIDRQQNLSEGITHCTCMSYDCVRVYVCLCVKCIIPLHTSKCITVQVIWYCVVETVW